MIAHLRGTVAGVAPDGAVIEVGGVGMRVQCTPGTLATLRPGESAQVATSLVVREDSLTLFGFVSDDERNVFELLQTASGVGPRLALAMLAVHAPDALRRAVEELLAAKDLANVAVEIKEVVPGAEVTVTDVDPAQTPVALASAFQVSQSRLRIHDVRCNF